MWSKKGAYYVKKPGYVPNLSIETTVARHKNCIENLMILAVKLFIVRFATKSLAIHPGSCVILSPDWKFSNLTVHFAFFKKAVLDQKVWRFGAMPFFWLICLS
ncbi:MAG: hypothetical protein AAF152_14535 [Cyanobacteria bacterium P01_A01_bin.114]